MSQPITKTILFDLGKVLVPFELSRAYQAIAACGGYPASELPARISSTGLVRKFETGLVEPEAFVEGFTSHLGMKVSFEEFREIWSCIFLRDTLVPDAMVKGLRARYRLLLLSNTNALHFENILQNYPILSHFDDYVLSYQVGAMKPDPEIYRAAIERAGCAAGECLFIDDLADNVAGAERMGIPGIQFHSREQLERDLAARGVRWD